jgi:NAD(P)H dehydrogenase (quinone)
MIAVAGASGKLGRLVIDHLVNRGPAHRLVAVTRTPEKVEPLAARGVQVRHGDYTRRETLLPALAGVTRLLLISTSGFDHRVDQHRNVIEAAATAGIAFLAYTSQLRTDTSTVPVAAEHRITEGLIRDSGIPFALLRNGWYTENYTENLEMPLAIGRFVGAAGAGRIAAATRADLAEAAAIVLTSPGHERQTYELAGDEAFTMTELADAVSGWAGRSLPYTDLSPADYRRALIDAGLPPAFADFYVASDVGIARGDLDSDSRDLQRLIGRPTERLRDTLARMPRP